MIQVAAEADRSLILPIIPAGSWYDSQQPRSSTPSWLNSYTISNKYDNTPKFLKEFVQKEDIGTRLGELNLPQEMLDVLLKDMSLDEIANLSKDELKELYNQKTSEASQQQTKSSQGQTHTC